MHNENLNKIAGHAAAMERIVTLLLSDALVNLSPADQASLKKAIKQEFPLPRTGDLGLADDWAGRSVHYERVISRVLGVAEEIAARDALQVTRRKPAP